MPITEPAALTRRPHPVPPPQAGEGTYWRGRGGSSPPPRSGGGAGWGRRAPARPRMTREVSYALEIALALPVRDRAVECLLLGAEEMHVVIDDVAAERGAREVAALEEVGGVAQR